MKEKDLSEFITSTVMCNISQLLAYVQMQNTFSQVFNLDMDSTISVFTCASPLQTLKGILLGIVDLYLGSKKSKELSGAANEKLYRMIELVADTDISTNSDDLYRVSKLLIVNTLQLAVTDLSLEEDNYEDVLQLYQNK